MAHKPDTGIRVIYNSRSGTRHRTISTLLMRKGDWGRDEEREEERKVADCCCCWCSFYSKSGRNRSSTRSITTTCNDGNSAYCPPRGTSVVSRTPELYARRPSRDGDNSLFRLRSLIERRPSRLPSSASPLPPTPAPPPPSSIQPLPRLFRLICPP